LEGVPGILPRRKTDASPVWPSGEGEEGFRRGYKNTKDGELEGKVNTPEEGKKKERKDILERKNKPRYFVDLFSFTLEKEKRGGEEGNFRRKRGMCLLPNMSPKQSRRRPKSLRGRDRYYLTLWDKKKERKRERIKRSCRGRNWRQSCRSTQQQVTSHRNPS